METSLHRALKDLYAATPDQTEVAVDGFRIDAIAADGELIEVQHASLSSIRSKCKKLLEQHQLRVVKPIIAKKWIVGLKKKKGAVVRRRLSPKKGHILDLFAELAHFMSVFPHPRLTLEVTLIDAEELRYPKARRWGKQFKVQDQRLLQVHETIRIQTTYDLLTLAGVDGLPDVFHTGDLASHLNRPRWLAQKMAYCLREAGAIELVGKKGNALLYSAVA